MVKDFWNKIFSKKATKRKKRPIKRKKRPIVQSCIKMNLMPEGKIASAFKYPGQQLKPATFLILEYRIFV